jgi:predicted GH43/DUF377 family glycosyl hydrolase
VVVKCSGLLLHLHFFFRFILKRIFGYALKCSVHIEAFFCGSLKVRYVSLSSAPCLRFLLRNLQLINWRQWGMFFPRGLHKRVVFCRSNITKLHFLWNFLNHEEKHTSHEKERSSYHSTIASINIYLVSQHNKWEVFRVGWASLQINTTKYDLQRLFMNYEKSVQPISK